MFSGFTACVFTIDEVKNMKTESDEGKRIYFLWRRSWEAGPGMAHFTRLWNRHAARNLIDYTMMYCSKRICDNTLLWTQLEIGRNDYTVNVSESYFMLIRSNKMQQYAVIYLLQNHCTCIGCPSHPSSGVNKFITEASGTGRCSDTMTCTRGCSNTFMYSWWWVRWTPETCRVILQ